MSKLQAIQIDENTILYVEAEDNIEIGSHINSHVDFHEEPTSEMQRGGGKGWNAHQSTALAQSFEQIQSTIKTYTQCTLNAFKDAALADVQKVNLEFGINVSGEGGMPYIAKGTVGCNVKITVECVFPQRQAAQRTGSTVRPPAPPLHPSSLS